MIYKTRGISLHYIRYGERSIIARVYTEKFGLQSYIVNGIRSPKAQIRMALFQPLSLLDLVVYHNKKKDIQRISEIKFLENRHSIPFNMYKISIALFLTEFLGKAIRQEGQNITLFEFLINSIRYFEGQEKDFENFHLIFLLKLSSFLGIKPISAASLAAEINSPMVLDKNKMKTFQHLMKIKYDDVFKIDHETRNEFLNAILDFYRYHFDYIGECKSVQVLREVLK
jgi:DNA repair protein RecO (recombination protein O)